MRISDGRGILKRRTIEGDALKTPAKSLRLLISNFIYRFAINGSINRREAKKGV